MKMAAISSTTSWKTIDLPVLASIEKTTNARELANENWPKWASGSTQFNRVLAYSLPTDSKLHSTLPSSNLTALLTERIDMKDDPNIYNYNIYLVAETTSGKLYQSPPIIPTDPAHHSSRPSTWFDELGSPE